MFSFKIKELFREDSNSSKKIEGKEKNERALPKRCKSCSDLEYCDLDYCLRWYH